MRQPRRERIDPAAVNPKLISTEGGLRGGATRQNVRDLNNFGEFGKREGREVHSDSPRRTDATRRRGEADSQHSKTPRQHRTDRYSLSDSLRMLDEPPAAPQPRKKRPPSSSRPRYQQRPAPEYDAGKIRRISAPGSSTDAPRGASSLAPARDTGLAVRRGIDRQRDEQRRNAIAWTVMVLVLIAAIIGGFIVWRAMSDRAVEGDTVVPLASLQSASAGSEGSAEPVVQDPTPIFASYHDLSFRAPVPLAALTEVLFHQASYTYALNLATPMPLADIGAAANKVGTNRDISAQAEGDDAVLVGSALQVWRSGRSGKPDTAVDVGAAAGTDVYSPLSGTVVKVRQYLLYGKYDDFEIHIQPTGHPELDLVLIHVDGVTVTPGTKVTAGVTKVGTVRLLSDRLNDQLADYTPATGDHVHVQLNDVHNANYKGLEGAITVTETAGSQ